MITYAVTTHSIEAQVLLSTDVYPTEADARIRWYAVVDCERPDLPSNTRVNLIEIRGRTRTLLASVDIHLPKEEACQQ